MAVAQARIRRRFLTNQRREALEGYLWISPWAFGFLVFVFGPMVASLALSTTDYTVPLPPRFIGPANYVKAFAEDPLFWGSLGRTALYAALNVPLGVTGSLLAAMLLNQRLKGTVAFRTFFFLPSLTPIVASAMLWLWILEPELGILNYLLWKMGIQGPAWLKSTEWAIPSLVIMALWHSIGGSRMIVFLAGLQGVPQELYDAAEVDGAGVWGKFRNVTLPMISPTVLFNLIIGIIGSFSVFSVAYVATNGGPAYATWFYVLHLYHNAFNWMRMGYASALAWIFFAVLLVFTFLQLRLSSRWVFYYSEGRGGEEAE